MKVTFPPKQNARDAVIARAAADLFARQGYAGTSTREIARLAGIAENTLFRRFESKENLFWAVLNANLSALELRLDLKSALRSDLAPELVLPQIVEHVVETAMLHPDVLRLAAVALLEMGAKGLERCRACFSPFLSEINSYLTEQMEQGKLRKIEPALVSTALLTLVLLHPVLGEFVCRTSPSQCIGAKNCQELSRFWIEVLVPIAERDS